MQWILRAPVRAELVLDVGVAEDAHLGVELAAVHAEEAPVERDRREEGEGFGEA